MSQPLSALLASGADSPQPDRAHRLLVAQRLAEAVDAVHAAGGVIGNLDDHRVLVAPDGTITVRGDPTVTPDASASALAHTAPELQGGNPGRSRPETQHDAFALAVLLFQLLMEGNHPYDGQWRGGGNLPDIPKAIQLGLYAYGGSAVTPPPGAPALSTLEPGLAELFARSFGATSAIFRTRPTGAEWAKSLAAARPDLPGTGLAASPKPAADREPDPTPEPTQAAPATPSMDIVAPPSEQGASGPPAPPPQSVAPPADPPALPTASAQPAARLAGERPTLPPADPEPAVPRATTTPAARPEPTPEPRQLPRRAMPTREVASRRPEPELQPTLRHDLWLLSWLPQPLLRRLKELQPWLDPEVYEHNRERLLSLVAVGIFLLMFLLGRFGSNRDATVPIAQPPLTPVARPTATHIAFNNPTVASFGSNFDVSDGVIPSTGERFGAYVRDRALHLEAFGRGARGKATFKAASAQGDFNFTVRVGETTGEGELLIYIDAPKTDRGRTWVFAIDPGASTWGLYEEIPSSTRLKTLIARHDYSRDIARQPLRTVTVTRSGDRIALLVNGIAVNPQIARAMPRIGGPVTVGVGAMIPDEPDYADKPFVVTVERVAMLAEEE